MNRVAIIFYSCIFVLLMMVGCTGGYSFTGASIPPDAKTISIQNFPNYASMVNPQLSQVLTDGLRNAFSSQTSLNLVDYDGDLDIKGEITNYTMLINIHTVILSAGDVKQILFIN